ncbi:hypothetical protein BDR26DRAFT_848796 [Obelidium mucronatum]|nr:hypothetical protein BDR26DRAFT_848796 [Obelidium mucronatum]
MADPPPSSDFHLSSHGRQSEEHGGEDSNQSLDRREESPTPFKAVGKQQRFTKEEKEILMKAMRAGCDAKAESRAQREELAKKLRTDHERIRQWFANNRKIRKVGEIDADDQAGGHAIGELHPTNLKRSFGYRDKPTVVMTHRIQRALSFRQRLLSKSTISERHVEYKVMSSIYGATYTCALKEDPECECHDWKPGMNCKHLLFVFLKVLGRATSDPLIFQKALLSTELDILFKESQNRDPRVLFEKESNRRKENGEIERNRPPTRSSMIGGVCPLCFDNYVTGDDCTWCQVSCGGNVHSECWSIWRKAAYKALIMIHCPHCGGILNLADQEMNQNILDAIRQGVGTQGAHRKGVTGKQQHPALTQTPNIPPLQLVERRPMPQVLRSHGVLPQPSLPSLFPYQTVFSDSQAAVQMDPSAIQHPLNMYNSTQLISQQGILSPSSSTGGPPLFNFQPPLIPQEQQLQPINIANEIIARFQNNFNSGPSAVFFQPDSLEDALLESLETSQQQGNDLSSNGNTLAAGLNEEDEFPWDDTFIS